MALLKTKCVGSVQHCWNSFTFRQTKLFEKVHDKFKTYDLLTW